jgi:hypothetical protein
MSGGFPIGLEITNTADNGTDTTNSAGLVIAPNASANTKGSYVQFTPPSTTASDCVLVTICTRLNDLAAVDYSLDFAVGTGGSQKVIFNNLVLPDTTVTSLGTIYQFPAVIPAGSAIWGATQCSGASAAGPRVSALISDGAFTNMEGAAGVDAVGFSTGSTKGTVITCSPGGVANTKGNYVQLTGSAARDYMGFCIALDSLGGTLPTDNSALFDIAVGGSGNEKIIVPNYFARFSASSFWSPVVSPFFAIPIPSGTAISARYQATTTTANASTNITLYGIYR